MKKYFIFLFVLFFSFKSFACSCDKIENVIKSYKGFDLIFVGKVIDVKEIKLKHKFFHNGKEHVYESDKDIYTFEVKTLYKGKQVSKRIKISTNPDEAGCGYYFEKGKSYLVYSYETDLEVNSDIVGDNKVKPFYTTHLCTRTVTINRVKKKEFRKLARYKRRYYNI